MGALLILSCISPSSARRIESGGALQVAPNMTLGFCPTLLAEQHTLLLAGGTKQSCRLSWRGPAAAAAARPGRAPCPPALRCPGGAALRKAGSIWRVPAAQPGGTGSEWPGGAAAPLPPNQQADDQVHFQQIERAHARLRVRLRFAGLAILGCVVSTYYICGFINWLVVLAAGLGLIAPVM